MTCSLIIRAYNEEKHIGRLLEGIKQQTFKDVEIILVDSGSTDKTVSIAESFGAKIVTIASKEFTFGRSLNYGIKEAKHEFIVMASAHVYPVYPDWLETLLKPFQDKKISLTYGKQRAPDSAKFSEQQIFHQWYPDESNSNQITAFCNNANAAIRKSLWEKHNYDETLTGLEDLEWSKWAKEQGYKIAYVAEAEIIHIHNETPRGVYNRYRREAMALRRIYPEAHFNFYDFLRLTITNIFSDLSHALQEKVLLKNFFSIFWFRFMQFHGTRMGHRETSLVTPQLRETFYYARGRKMKEEREREIKPINYSNEEIKTWEFIGISHDGDKFKINSISIWSHKWQEIPNQFAHVKDPSYGQEFKFHIYVIEYEDKRIEFATGEFSPNVWGIYIQK
jgi:rhamnosyltransferase